MVDSRPIVAPPSAVGPVEFIELPSATASVPGWACDLVNAPTEVLPGGIRVRRSKHFQLLSAAVPESAVSDGNDLERETNNVYRAMANLLDGGKWHPVRFWNFVPRILADGGNGLDRYMRFNAGRHTAFIQWFGSDRDFERMLPTASAVGHAGGELIIHALSAKEPGASVSNPRQCQPHRYSRRYGPIPPCFARATLLPAKDARQLLLVGGTASVRGEQSMHPDDLAAQLDETFRNLAAVAAEAYGGGRCDSFECYRELRIYHVRGASTPEISRALVASFPNVTRVEWVQADLCRHDLSVEIEGLAEG